MNGLPYGNDMIAGRHIICRNSSSCLPGPDLQDPILHQTQCEYADHLFSLLLGVINMNPLFEGRPPGAYNMEDNRSDDRVALGRQPCSSRGTLYSEHLNLALSTYTQEPKSAQPKLQLNPASVFTVLISNPNSTLIIAIHDQTEPLCNGV